MGVPLRVLIVEDSEDDTLLLLHELRGGEFDVDYLRVDTAEALRQALASQSWDLILADYTLPHFSGSAALAILHESGFDVPFIIVSGTVKEQDAIDMMRQGAQDFILKNNMGRLAQAIQREIREAEVRQQRRQIGAMLQKEQDRAQQYLDIAGVIIVALDTDGRINLINKKGCELLGYRAEELIGKNWFDLVVPPQKREEIREVFDHIIAGKLAPIEYYENPVQTKNGDERIIAFHNAAIRDELGNIIGTLSSGEDITERIQAQEALERERAFLSSAIEFLPFPIVFSTPSGEVLRANQASYRFFQGTDSKNWWDVTLLTYDTHVPVAKDQWPMMRSARGETVTAVEGIIVRPDGKEVPVTAYSAPVYVEGKLIASVVAFVDITALKEMDRAKNRFLAILSHELRTPLTNILGWVGEAISDPQLVPQALQVIRRNAEIQQRMLENLLEVSRLIHGKLTLRLERLELWRLAERVANEMQPMAAERNITMTLVPPSEALPIQADRKRMAEVIGNLLDNAIKYTRPGGTVVVTGYRDGDQAALSVEDTGRGFPPEEVPTLFELFFLPPQEDANRGLHLGLALAKNIMELHGGRIIARSPGLGKGSTFTIELPLAAMEGCTPT